MKVAVYAISKDEESFIKRCIDSAKDADYFVLADTGSADRTVEIARENGAIVHSITVRPWRFDVARNAALSLVPADADVCVAIDIDEVLEPGWREEVERVWTPGTTRLRYPFEWSYGGVCIYDRIHARFGYYWKHPCHEALALDTRVTERLVQTSKLLSRHLPDPLKSRGQYLDILRAGTKENPSDARNSFYYARELTFYSMWDEAITELCRYLSLPAATWGAERGYAARLIGKSLEALGRAPEAEEWYVVATQEAPERRESWLDLADYHHRVKNWKACMAAAEKSLKISEFSNVWPVDATAWGSKPYDLMALSCYYLGNHQDAVYYGTLALEMEPGNLRLSENLRWYHREKK